MELKDIVTFMAEKIEELIAERDMLQEKNRKLTSKLYEAERTGIKVND